MWDDNDFSLLLHCSRNPDQLLLFVSSWDSAPLLCDVVMLLLFWYFFYFCSRFFLCSVKTKVFYCCVSNLRFLNFISLNQLIVYFLPLFVSWLLLRRKSSTLHCRKKNRRRVPKSSFSCSKYCALQKKGRSKLQLEISKNIEKKSKVLEVLILQTFTTAHWKMR